MQTLDYCICGRLQAEVLYIRIKLHKMEYKSLTIRFSNYSGDNLPCLSKHGSSGASCKAYPKRPQSEERGDLSGFSSISLWR